MPPFLEGVPVSPAHIVEIIIGFWLLLNVLVALGMYYKPLPPRRRR